MWLFFIRFGFYQKEITKLKFKKKKEPKPVQTDRFRLCFLGQKPVQTGLAQFFPVWHDFSWFGSIFSGFGLVFLVFFPVWVGFGFFGFMFIKPKPKRSVFFTVWFFQLFFFCFLDLISFLIFFAYLYNNTLYIKENNIYTEEKKKKSVMKNSWLILGAKKSLKWFLWILFLSTRFRKRRKRNATMRVEMQGESSSNFQW